jgi:hypothetical protein
MIYLIITVRRSTRRTHRLPWSKWQACIFSRYLCSRQGPAQEVLGHSGDSLSLSGDSLSLWVTRSLSLVTLSLSLYTSNYRANASSFAQSKSGLPGQRTFDAGKGRRVPGGRPSDCGIVHLPRGVGHVAGRVQRRAVWRAVVNTAVVHTALTPLCDRNDREAALGAYIGNRTRRLELLP